MSPLEYIDVTGEHLEHVIQLMEEREDWTIDDEKEVRDLLVRFSELYGSPHLSEWAINHPPSALIALGTLSTGKCIEIVKALDDARPGFANALLLYASREKHNPLISVLPKRLFCLARAGMLELIFTAERFQAIEAVIRSSQRREQKER